MNNARGAMVVVSHGWVWFRGRGRGLGKWACRSSGDVVVVGGFGEWAVRRRGVVTRVINVIMLLVVDVVMGVVIVLALAFCRVRKGGLAKCRWVDIMGGAYGHVFAVARYLVCRATIRGPLKKLVSRVIIILGV